MTRSSLLTPNILLDWRGPRERNTKCDKPHILRLPAHKIIKMIHLELTADPTIYRRGDENTTIKDATESVSKAYNDSVDTLDILLHLSVELRTNGNYDTAQALALMEQQIERMKSILEAENLRFYHMTKVIRSSDKVEKLRAWKAMIRQDVDIAILKGGEVAEMERRRRNVRLAKWAVGVRA